MKNKNFDIAFFSNYRSILNQYSDTYIKNSCSVIVEEDDKKVLIACSKSKKQFVERKAKEYHLPKEIELIVVKDSEFEEFIGNVVEGNVINKDASKVSDASDFSLDEVSETSPIVNIINATCLGAIRMNASDIHIVPENGKTVIKFRIDGVLQVIKELDKSIFNVVSSRIKVMSNLNIMEQRLPQDGHMKLNASNREIDFRVSIVPVIGGESIVLRLFNADTQKADLEELGFTKDNYKMLANSIHISNGLILISGPTGSGKTTTIHSLINLMEKKSLKIITIEDPVERVIPDVEQIQVNESIGLTFESVLRCVLRQDPDVIMVGEIRDEATAELAVRASLTGHIIISTLHTNDSISTISRLINLGIEPYLVGSVLKYSIAQRLVRRLCPECKKLVNQKTKIYKAVGCKNCNHTGYKGRTAVSEIFKVDENLVELISKNESVSTIKKYLVKNKMKFISEDAMLKVKSGETSVEEVKREALV
ncbi:MAG: type II/IV secretion system protein [Treponema sp.]|nr:type II/IV secretion system protein [Treponema sp.]